MSLGRIDPGSRGTFRLHGWLLMLWATVVGLLTSAFLLHGLKVHSMAVRYAVGAGAVYFLGFVLGGCWYARWWNSRPRAVADFPAHAAEQDRLAYEQRQDAVHKKMDYFFNWGGNLVGSSDDPLSALLAVIGLIVVAFGLVLFAGYMPFLATDMLAGYLAEIVLEFVIGAALMRRILKPRPLDQYWAFVIRKTWLAGLFMMVVVSALGYTLQSISPEARTLFQALR